MHRIQRCTGLPTDHLCVCGYSLRRSLARRFGIVFTSFSFYQHTRLPQAQPNSKSNLPSRTFSFLTLPIQPFEKFLARNDNPFANLESREIAVMGQLISPGSGNAKGGSNISFPPYLQLAPRRWGQRGQSVAALTARGRGLDCFQPQSRLPTVLFPLAGSSLPGRRAPCAFPNLRCDPRCWLFSCLDL